MFKAGQYRQNVRNPSAKLARDAVIELILCIHRLDRHGVGSEILPDEAGVPSFLDALDAAQPGWPHALSTLDVRLTYCLLGAYC